MARGRTECERGASAAREQCGAGEWGAREEPVRRVPERSDIENRDARAKAVDDHCAWFDVAKSEDAE